MSVRHNEEAMACMWLNRGNEALERGAEKTAQRCFDKAQQWLDRVNASKDDEDFRQAYLIVASQSGLVYGRRRLRSYVLGKLRRRFCVGLGLVTPERLVRVVDHFLGDPDWMRRKRGSTTGSIVNDIEFECDQDPRLLWGPDAPCGAKP
jgi:hypothetical protein